MNNLIGMAVICIGVLINLLGCIGLVRLQDTYSRLQAVTKCIVLGTCLILLGAAVVTASWVFFFKAAVCCTLLLIAAPTAAHALAKAAHSSGAKIHEHCKREMCTEDELARDQSGDSQ